MARAAKKKAAKKKSTKRTAKKRVTSKRAKRVTSKKSAAKKSTKRKVAKKKTKKSAKKTARKKVARKTKVERAHDELVANAQHALELKNAAPKPFRPENRTSHHGMAPLPNDTIAPAGAVEAEEAYVPMERTHRSG